MLYLRIIQQFSLRHKSDQIDEFKIFDFLQIAAQNRLAICPSNGSYVTKIIEEQKAFLESTAIESGDVNNNTELRRQFKGLEVSKEIFESVQKFSESKTALKDGKTIP